MKTEKTLVISASRRTDIPAYYLDWFIKSLKQGVFEVEQPFTHEIKKIQVPKDSIHSIVFWSKNYEHFLKKFEKFKDLNLYFHFTINSSDQLLEPNVPSLPERILQLEKLVSLFGRHKVVWRFDPIIFYIYHGHFYNNLTDFDYLTQKARDLGLRHVTTSFMSRYRKMDRRIKKINGFEFIYPCLSEQVNIMTRLAEKAHKLGINIRLCCQKELAAQSIPNISLARCIDVERLTHLYGSGPAILSDRSQRTSKGCGCHVALDIGSYGIQPCLGKCLYCYANPDFSS